MLLAGRSSTFNRGYKRHLSQYKRVDQQQVGPCPGGREGWRRRQWRLWATGAPGTLRRLPCSPGLGALGPPCELCTWTVCSSAEGPPQLARALRPHETARGRDQRPQRKCLSPASSQAPMGSVCSEEGSSGDGPRVRVTRAGTVILGHPSS